MFVNEIDVGYLKCHMLLYVLIGALQKEDISS